MLLTTLVLFTSYIFVCHSSECSDGDISLISLPFIPLERQESSHKPWPPLKTFMVRWYERNLRSSENEHIENLKQPLPQDVFTTESSDGIEDMISGCHGCDPKKYLAFFRTLVEHKESRDVVSLDIVTSALTRAIEHRHAPSIASALNHPKFNEIAPNGLEDIWVSPLKPMSIFKAQLRDRKQWELDKAYDLIDHFGDSLSDHPPVRCINTFRYLWDNPRFDHVSTRCLYEVLDIKSSSNAFKTKGVLRREFNLFKNLKVMKLYKDHRLFNPEFINILLAPFLRVDDHQFFNLLCEFLREQR